ncbi:MAG TPA: DUF4124 domain-containing protein [Methylophilaceae bacterium]|nr:DUF4124 domain-containing protein [Methylophilaceae bacterium]
MYPRQCTPLLIIALMLAATTSVQAEAKRIKKWVDGEGVTHYGDVLPPSYAGEQTTEMNSQGIKVKPKPPSANSNAKQANKPMEMTEQERRDKALLNSFTTAKEIELARDRNLQMDQASLQSLGLRLSATEERLQKTNASIAGFSKNKKPVPADLVREQKAQQTEISNIKNQIKKKQASMDATRARFDNDKQRFIELKAGSTPAEEAPTDTADAVPDVTPAQPAP